MNNIISVQNLNYYYNDGGKTTPVLTNLNLEVEYGESIAILGQSGCGKSTFLNLLGGIDKPNSGRVLINNTDLNVLNDNKITKLRAKYLGFVYQFHHLLKDFSALYNTMMPLLISGIDKTTAFLEAKKILDMIGLKHRINHFPAELSGGERQRVAIARALIVKPKCLLADEPTGNLDYKNAREVLGLLIELNKQQNSALILVTHDTNIANKMHKILTLENGILL